jgi:hypothetical protein
MSEKEKILQDYNRLVATFDKVELLGIYLQKIIEGVDSENEVDLMELEFDLQKIITLYAYNNEKIARFEKELDQMLSKFNLTDLSLSSEDLVEVSTRIFKLLEQNHED